MVSYSDLHVQVIYKKNVPFDNVPSERLPSSEGNASLRARGTSPFERGEHLDPLGIRVFTRSDEGSSLARMKGLHSLG